MVKDTVCNMEFDETNAGYSLILGDKTYYFCSEGCKAEFERHPDDYSNQRDKPEEDASV